VGKHEFSRNSQQKFGESAELAQTFTPWQSNLKLLS